MSEARQYKHVVLGLIFLKYISDSFDEHPAKLVAGKGDFAGANRESPLNKNYGRASSPNCTPSSPSPQNWSGPSKQT